MEDRDYNSLSRQIRFLGSMDDLQLAQYLSDTHDNISNVAPEMASYIFGSIARGIRFLFSALPFGAKALPEDSKELPSLVQQNNWLELYDVVQDPISLVEKLAKETLTGPELNCLKTVYPDIYADLNSKIVAELSLLESEGKSVPYSKRLAISKFIGVPLDSTMTSQSVQVLMQVGQTQPGQAQPVKKSSKSNKPSGPELTHINKVNELDETLEQARESDHHK